MLNTRATELLHIRHPIVLGGMAGHTGPSMVAAVSNAGGLGVQGCAVRTADEIAKLADEIRGLTDQPFGLNLLLFRADDAAIDSVLAARPAVFSTAWAFPEQDLQTVFSRAHEVGAQVMHMVPAVEEAVRAAEAGADLVVAQGTEAGGHAGLISTMVLVPLVVRAVAPLPVLAAGGIATGPGLAAALALGAEGAMLGTRFLATLEAPIQEGHKESVVASDGHNTLLTEVPDIAGGFPWPGAYARVARNQFIEDWSGREGELRYRRAEVHERTRSARAANDSDHYALYMGQSAGLVDNIGPAAEVINQIIKEAEDVLAHRLATMLDTTR